MGWHCQQWRHWLWSDASTLYETPASGCSQKLHEGRAVVLPFIVSNTCKLKYKNTKPSVTQSWKQRIHFIADTVVVMELLKFHIWLSHNFPCHICPQVGTQLSTCFIVQLIIHWNYFTTLFWTHWKRPKKKCSCWNFLCYHNVRKCDVDNWILFTGYQVSFVPYLLCFVPPNYHFTL